MFSHLKDPNFDSLYCAEEHFDDELCGGSDEKELELEFPNEIHIKAPTFTSEAQDLLWDDDEVVALLSKEKKQSHLVCIDINFDGTLKTARTDAVKWMLKVVAHYRFNASTAVLAANYYDRFVASASFQRDKPWMSQLSAVACLSLAAKVEETQVPLLLDFQVEESRYVFEAKTIQRFELLVLSTLQWKMHPATPISFIDHIVRRFELIREPHCNFMTRCESVLLSIINDCRFLCYKPSVIAAATMSCVIQELDPLHAVEYQNQLTSLLRTSKVEVEDCSKLIMETMDTSSSSSSVEISRKRRLESFPTSPSGVIDAYYFSCDSSNDSWSAVPSSSPEPFCKRIRAQNRI